MQSGSAVGQRYLVTGNGEDGLTLEGDPAQAGLKAGDSVAILPTLEEYLGQPMGQIIADNLSRFEERMQRE